MALKKQSSPYIELPRWSPAFILSDDSHYLALSQWIRRFGLFLQQRLLIVDIRAGRVDVSRFTLADGPLDFANGRLEIEVSSSFGVNWMWSERLVIDVPEKLDGFTSLPTARNKTPTNNPIHWGGEVERI